MAYLLVKANYIDRAVFDTNHLSIIRGGGCLLKSAIEHVTNEFSYTGRHHLACVSSGPTQGIFKVHGDSDELENAVVDCLNRDLLFRLCNFVVVTSKCDSLNKAEKALAARYCRQQLSSLSVVPDDPDTTMFTDRPCDLNGVRAGSSLSPKEMIDNKAHILSESCALRLNYGRAQRQIFVENENDPSDNSTHLDAMREAIDIENLSACEKYPELNHHLALLCIRNVNFDQLQSRYLQQGKSTDEKPRLERDFHELVISLRRGLLANICTRLSDGSEHQFRDGLGVGKYSQKEFVRFETLLWDSHEMIFIVPAWLGFELQEFVLESTRQWRIHNQPVQHVSGMVFCESSVPLSVSHSAVTRLASTLEDTYDSQGDSQCNMFDCLIINKEICPDQYSILGYYYSQYGELAKCRPSLNADISFSSLRVAVQRLFEPAGISIEKLQLMCHDLLNTSWSRLCSSPMSDRLEKTPGPAPWLADKRQTRETESMTRFCAEELRLVNSCSLPDLRSRLAVVADLLCGDADSFPERIWFWLHLSELRPYLCPLKQEKLH